MCERLYVTGCAITTTIPQVVASNFAGCISRVLFSRARHNAHTTVPYPTAYSFSPREAYTEMVNLLYTRSDHTYRLARHLDDHLTILHPGIAGLDEHGSIPRWMKEWDLSIVAATAALLPSRFSSARTACRPAAPHVSTRLTLTTRATPRTGPHPRPCPYRIHISLRLSVGLGPQPTPPAGPAHASPPRANPPSSPAQPSPTFTHCVCGSRQRLESIVSHPDLPLSRSHVLSNLLASMDSHDTIRFSRH